MIDLLTAADLCHLNERCCRAYGGKHRPPSEATETELSKISERLAAEPYDSLADKAAGYFHELLTEKYFAAANERTALLAARMIVRLNGGAFHKKLKTVKREGHSIPTVGNGATEIWQNLVTETAAGNHFEADCREWFRCNVTPPKSPG